MIASGLRSDSWRRQKSSRIDIARGRRRCGHADVFGDELDSRLHLGGIEPAKTVLLHIGGDGKIADNRKLGDDDFWFQAGNELDLVLRSFGRIGKSKFPALETGAHEAFHEFGI